MTEIEVFAFNAMPFVHLRGLTEFLIHGAQKSGLRGIECHAILRSFRSSQRRHHVGHVELQGVREHRIRRVRGAPHALGFGIGLDEGDAFGIAARGRQIVDRSLVDRKEATRRTIFRRHIRDRGAVCDGHVIEPRTVELDEFSDHAALAQHLRHGQHEIGRRDAFLQPAGQPEADDLRQQHRDLLTEHDGLGLDSPHAPTEHSQAVDHRCVRIGADERIGIGKLGTSAFRGTSPDRLGEEFEIDLMANARAGRNHPEVRKSTLPPFQKAIPLAVALIFQLDVLAQRLAIAEGIDDHGMIDDQIHRHERIDLLRIAAEILHRVPHRGEIDDCRNAGEILHQYAGRPEGDFLFGRSLVMDPLRRILDVGLAGAAAVVIAQHVLDDDFQRERQRGEVRQAIPLRRVKRIVAVGLCADRKRLAGVKAIEALYCHDDGPSVRDPLSTWRGLSNFQM